MRYICLFCGMRSGLPGAHQHALVCENRHPSERHEAHIQQVLRQYRQRSRTAYSGNQLRVWAEEDVARDYQCGDRWKEPKEISISS